MKYTREEITRASAELLQPTVAEPEHYTEKLSQEEDLLAKARELLESIPSAIN